MSKKLPFEDAFKNKMNDLPAGDENAAWQKMKQLLEEKKKRKPFAWLTVCAICACLLMIGGICIWINLSHNNRQRETAATEKNKTINKKTNQLPAAEQTSKSNNTTNKNSETSGALKQINSSVGKLKSKSNEINSSSNNRTLKDFINHNPTQKKYNDNKRNDEAKPKKIETSKKNSINISSEDDSNQIALNKKENSNVANLNASDKIKSITSILTPPTSKNDSVNTQANAVNNLKQSPNFDTALIKKHSPISLKQKQFFVEAGIQLKQQIPVNGQKIIAYNYTGNKGLFKDYIPSVFIKFEKNKRWFFQGEFSFATPQLVKQFSYSRQTKADYALSTVTLTAANLQKNYYNELPLSFNYYIKPHWSIGTGIIYGWFHGAVAEQVITTNNIKAGTLITAKTMIPFKNFTDSFLYKNQASLLLQTGYSLKRWSFMLRYKKDIQPYIEYTLPNGTAESKKNSSLELNIGYRFIKKPF